MNAESEVNVIFRSCSHLFLASPSRLLNCTMIVLQSRMSVSVARVSTMERVSTPSTTTHVAVPQATLAVTVRLVGILELGSVDYCSFFLN